MVRLSAAGYRGWHSVSMNSRMPYRKVIVEGDSPNWCMTSVKTMRSGVTSTGSIAERYVPPEAAAEYISNTIEQPRGLYRVDLAAAKRSKSLADAAARGRRSRGSGTRTLLPCLAPGATRSA